MTVLSVMLITARLGTKKRNGVLARYVYETVTPAESAGATLTKTSVCRRFDWDRAAAELSDLYEDVAASRPARQRLALDA